MLGEQLFDDAQRFECIGLDPNWDRQRFDVLAVGLREHKPIRAKMNRVKVADLPSSLPSATGRSSPLRLTVTGMHKHDRPFAFPDVSPFVLPAHERRDRAEGNPTFGTLHERQDLIADAVAVEGAIGGREMPGSSAPG